ncbi:apoptosis-stimulating of p53 protein 2 isoform X3 [Octopus sinensis]|uniref:Apoptosis-stimulating of p53 protein 2 isoform X3 n=1 Tax=Octopus sinensis TaxID=2607531 RepID=A0A6P7SLK0_9MOLL|nr:apoptosis-stimulating of p53 protein 2 isoform X3 [Octopus sinensis]
MSTSPVSSHLYPATMLSSPGHVTGHQQQQYFQQQHQQYYVVSRPTNTVIPPQSRNIAAPYNYKPVDQGSKNMLHPNYSHPLLYELPHGGVDMTFGELQEISAHQQRELEAQQKILLTKEQRLKYLRNQDAQHQQTIAENDQLRKLRERVESQELKLKKLKALKGQAEQQKLNNGNLNSELESIKILFTEKEKELALAVAKVEQLTKQLEQIRIGAFTINGKINPDHPNAMAAIELDKLRKKLALHNKLNEQQSIKMNNQQDLLMKKRRDVSQMDKRIAELQLRLKKRLAQQLQQQHQKSNNAGQQNKVRPASNVAAVEPYHHAPRHQNISVDETHSDLAFSKEKPKYQSLPNNIYNNQENIAINETPVPGFKKTKPDDVIEDYQIPLVVSVDKFPTNDGNNSNSSQYPTKTKQISPSVNNDTPPKFPSNRLSANISNFLPKPFGSTYSTSMLSGRGSNSSQSNVIPDEVRQDGSGQSSPATSETSQNGIMVQNLSNFVPSTKSNSPQFTQADTTIPSKQFHYSSPESNNCDTTDSVQKKLNNNLPVTSVNGSTYNGSVDYKKSFNLLQSETYDDMKESKPNAQISPTITNDKPTLMTSTSKNITSDSGLTHSVNTASSKPQYASNSVIENTYMTRPTLPENHYVASLHHAESTHLNGNQGGQVSQTDHTSSGFQNKVKSISPLIPSTPTHRDLASDKGSFKANTPKNMRRKHSEFEHEEYVKTLKKTADSSRSVSTSSISAVSQYKPDTSDYTSSNDNRHWQINGENIPESVNQTSSSNSSGVSNGNQQNSSNNNTKSNKLKGPTTKNLPKKSLLKTNGSKSHSRRVCFDPLALLLDASLEGELGLVMETAHRVSNASASNEEGITPLHNAICAGHHDIVKFLVEFGCDVNAPDSDGWTPLHCAASCNNLYMVQLLVNHGACIFATTLSDHETAAKKCEEGEAGYEICSDYLYSVQEKLGIVNNGKVFTIFSYEAQNSDELTFKIGEEITVLRKGDENEKEWWWSRIKNREGYVARNMIGLQPRILAEESRWSNS